MSTAKIILGVIICFGVGYTMGRKSIRKEQLSQLSIKQLNARMEELVQAEDFESAALIRDVIKVKETRSA